MSIMEKLVVQSDIANIPCVGDFVGIVCSDLHIDNYCATIAVAVSKAAEYAVAFSTNLAVTSELCRGGVRFTVAADQSCFVEGMSDESVLMAKMLSDQFEVVDEGRAIRLMFAVEGISSREAAQRQQVLEKFYAPVLVEA